ncbi:hypothetical protein [Selenomonas sp. AB3002]|uniref:hypothetical protein n=1 Tax=Selenomonas sp. AB3002 TaxID=1392502 RepID=UPI000A4327CB
MAGKIEKHLRLQQEAGEGAHGAADGSHGMRAAALGMVLANLGLWVPLEKLRPSAA